MFLPPKLALANVLVLVALFPAVSAWSADSTNEAGSDYFERHIRPILAQRCNSCHGERAADEGGGLRLDSADGWSRGGERGASVIPGNVDGSPLILAVRYSDPDLRMPPAQQLPAEEIARLEQWIRMGAPFPSPRQATAVVNPSDPVAGRSHWAFQPLVQPPIPPVRDLSWPRSAIDRFVLAKLEEKGLRPVPDADAGNFLRRISFQLTGLPPTTDQSQLLRENPGPEALERLVDQLLSSPHFGERWGRHWLDLARYADSNGLDENFLFREAWRYRNWVLGAMNADLPFDRFLLEQLAGDQLPFDSLEQRDRQRIAAGFLVIGPKVLLGNDERKQRMEIADEQIDTIGRAVLGQTLGCARCHDHKFDPFPTADYYALAGILASTQVMEKRYMLNEQRVMERLAGLGPEGDEADASYEEYWRAAPERKKKLQQAKSALAVLKKGEESAIAELLGKEPESLAEAARDASQTLAQRLAAQEAWVARLTSELGKPPTIPPRAMIPTDIESPADEHIRLAGQFDRLGERVPRGFLQVLGDNSPAEIPAGQSGRLALGQWLTDTSHGAGQLAARVLANRLWHHLIGCGLVRTVDNFGRTGESPSHPELLDYLACELIDSGWSVKAIVRQIVLSRTFALSSQDEPNGQAVDPDNRLLWRAHRRRLDPESLRDAALAAAGQLDLNPRDSTVGYLGDQATAVGDNKVRRRTDFPCRSVYLPVIRNDLPELFDVFDFANPHTATGARPKTTVPTQGLFMLNGELMMDAADATAQRILDQAAAGDPEGTINRMYQGILNVGSPTQSEREAIRAFLKRTEARLIAEGDSEPRRRALAMACHALFASSRFQYLE